jgi:hypothetical protein
MTLPIYTRHQLLARVRDLETHLPLSGQLPWPSNYSSHKEHWTRWLEHYDGPGYYGRSNHDRTAQYIWQHIQNPGMVVWLGEAAGVAQPVIRHSLQLALSTTGRVASVTAAARKPLPWAMVAGRLWPPAT